jgi:hypothetical protein
MSYEKRFIAEVLPEPAGEAGKLIKINDTASVTGL